MSVSFEGEWLALSLKMKIKFEHDPVACKTILKPAETAYKQALKIQDRKKSYHHCRILKKHDLFSWENMLQNAEYILVFKIFYGLAPAPLQEFRKKKKYPNNLARASSRADCVVLFRTSGAGHNKQGPHRPLK